MSNAPLLSVCICTFNGAARISEVLAALADQTEHGPDWEVLVVDNASTDATVDVVREAQGHFSAGRLRLVTEPQAGLMYARLRATREATAPFIAFLDDDNVPEKNYIEAVLVVLRSQPGAGVIGGKVTADWVGEPTPLGRAVADFALAVCDRGDQAFSYTDVTGGPAGAGMIVRRELMEKIFSGSNMAEQMGGRKGASLMSGDDTAIVIRAHQLGYPVRYEPSLVVRHRIPAARTTFDYLARLYEGIGRGQASMRPLFDAKARRQPTAFLIAAKDGLRWLAGQLRGPGAALRQAHGELASDLHRLQQRQVYGRFRQGLRGGAS